MYKYGKASKARLSTCHEKLQLLCNELIKYRDVSILCGHRDEKDQTEAYSKGLSKVEFPNSKHNIYPSLAVDMALYHKQAPHIHYSSRDEFLEFAGFVRGISATLGIELRWGGDWDNDNDFTDQTFNDWVHWELR